MFEIVKLPNDVAWRTAGDARYGAKPPEISAMAYSTLDGLAGAARCDQRLSLRNAADRHVSGKFGMAVIGFELVEIIWHFDDTSANWLRTSLF